MTRPCLGQAKATAPRHYLTEEKPSALISPSTALQASNKKDLFFQHLCYITR